MSEDVGQTSGDQAKATLATSENKEVADHGGGATLPDLGQPLSAKWQQRFIILLLVWGVIAAALGMGLPRLIDVEVPLTHYYYHFMWLLLGSGLAVISWFWCEHGPLSRAQAMRLGVALALGVVGAVVMISAAEWEYRVLADEANLLGLAMSLNIDRTYRNILEGSFYYDTFHASVYSLDPRPALHPFLMSLLHDTFGYQSYHGFVLNFAASALAIAAVVYIGWQLSGFLVGLLAGSMLLASPIFLLSGTSAGFEPLNLAVTTIAAWATYMYIKDPRPRRLELMAFAAVAAAHCRYESVLFVLPVGAAVFYRWQDLKFDRRSWILFVVPALLIPYCWQRALHALAHEVDASKPVFSPRYLGPNLKQFYRYAFDRGSSDFPMNHWIACLAAGGLVLLLTYLLQRSRSNRERIALGLGIAGVLLVFLTHMSCWVVDFRTVAVQRYATSYAAGLALLAAWPLWRLSQIPAIGRAIALSLAAFVVMHGLAKAGHNTQGRWLTLYREYKMNLAFLSQQPKEGTTFIADRPGMYAVHEYGAMSFESANKNPKGVLDGIRRKLTPRVFVEQRYYYNRLSKPEPKLSDKLKTEPVLEYQNDANYYVRISRVLLPDDDTTSESETGKKDGKGKKGTGSASQTETATDSKTETTTAKTAFGKKTKDAPKKATSTASAKTASSSANETAP